MSTFATSEAMSRRMQLQKRKDTTPEVALRRELHRLGLRYRVHVPPVPTFRRKADVVFSRSKVAVYLDGCFWHGCPSHGNTPLANPWYWPNKIATNKARDRDTDARLKALGWVPIRVWEHEDPAIAAVKIRQIVAHRRKPTASA